VKPGAGRCLSPEGYRPIGIDRTTYYITCRLVAHGASPPSTLGSEATEHHYSEEVIEEFARRGPPYDYHVRVDVRDNRKSLPDFPGLTILIVEDDFDSRQFLCEILRARGATVFDTDNVAKAKEIVTSTKVDLIVTDLALPGEDGAAFLTWLRAPERDKSRTVPVIAVTGFYDTYPPAEVRGWAAYIQKPVGIEDLVRTIAAVLKIPMDSPEGGR
jgi:CheY-like chemotaxis protein